MFSAASGDHSICKNEEVGEDPDVEKDDEGKPIIEFADCCNNYTPIDVEKVAMLAKAKEQPRSRDELGIFCPLVKVDVAKREVWGIVTAESPDKEGEICDYDTTVPYYKDMVEEMSKATDGANIFPLRVMHGLKVAGKGISIEFRDNKKEIYMGFKVVDDNEWKLVQENVYTGFSQGGRYIKRWADGDFVRYTAKPGEVSLVDVPCLTRAHFDYVKADGSVEMRKFSIPTEVGALPNRPVAVPEQVTPSVDTCSCDCPNCKGSNCAACGTGACRMAGKVAKMKYLITSKAGVSILPYAKADDSPNYRLMLKAWRTLHNDKDEITKTLSDAEKSSAIKKLRNLYAKNDVDNPLEKAATVEKKISEILTDTIQSRAYGQLGKGMYTISRFSDICESIKYLWLSLEYEREQEGDESPVTDDLREIVEGLLDALLVYTEEQILEEKSRLSNF
jgi:hypothetical protein